MDALYRVNFIDETASVSKVDDLEFYQVFVTKFSEEFGLEDQADPFEPLPLHHADVFDTNVYCG